MPYAEKRPCSKCGVLKTKAERRDPGVTRGRPPATCQECRAKYPELEAYQQKNRDRRDMAVVRQEAYFLRSDSAVAAYQAKKFPDGQKTCPPTSGCGETKDLDRFSPNRYQADGLFPVCTDCEPQYGAISQLVASTERV